MKLESTNKWVQWLSELTIQELHQYFPDRFYRIKPDLNKDANTFIFIKNDAILFEFCKNHVKFLDATFERWMVYPCDDGGNKLKEPLDWRNPSSPLYRPDVCPQYKKAKERVLFVIDLPEENIELLLSGGFKISYLIGKVNIELTQAGINILTQ